MAENISPLFLVSDFCNTTVDLAQRLRVLADELDKRTDVISILVILNAEFIETQYFGKPGNNFQSVGMLEYAKRKIIEEG